MIKKNLNKVHETAIIDKGAIIGKNCRIWHWTHISKGAIIGDYCSFGQNVFVGNNVKIGNNVKVQNNVSVYDNVILENDVFCGPSMVFTNVYNPRSAISRKNEYQNTIVREGVTFGANSTIICGIEIGKHAFIGAGSLIKHDVKPYALMVGVPAKHIGWMSKYGERVDLPLKGIGSWQCDKTGHFYHLQDENLTCIN